MKKLFSVIIVTAMCFALLACGSDKYVIVTDVEYRPFVYFSEDGSLTGLDIEMLTAVAENQHFEFELRPLGWDMAIAACKAGEADGMMACATITQERIDDGWIFSDSYFNSTQCFAVAADSKIEGFGTCRGETVAAKTGTQGAKYAESVKDEYNFKIKYFDDSILMFKAVENGTCVGCFEDTPAIKAYIADGTHNLKVLDNTQNQGTQCGFVVFSPEHEDLIKKFNRGLASIKESGKYKEIIDKYMK